MEASTLALYLYFVGPSAEANLKAAYRYEVGQVMKLMSQVNDELASDQSGDPRDVPIDLTLLVEILNELGEESSRLSFQAMAKTINEEARRLDLFKTSVKQVYTLYRLQSLTAPHINLRVLDGYLEAQSGTRVSTVRGTLDASPTPANRIYCLHFAAFSTLTTLASASVQMPHALSVKVKYEVLVTRASERQRT